MKLTVTETKTVETEYVGHGSDPHAVLYEGETLYGVFANRSLAKRFVQASPMPDSDYSLVPLTGDTKITF